MSMSSASPKPDSLLHGFKVPEFVEDEDFSTFIKEYSSVLERRRNRWRLLLSQNSLKRDRQLKRFCRKGIPINTRCEMWLALSGAADALEKYPGVYAEAVLAEPSQKILDVIVADIPRTFPENIYFCDANEPETKLFSLQRVLTAFANRFPDIGYCQGFNYIASIMLLVVEGETVQHMEEQAFWLLDALINQILPAYYSDGMVSLRTDCLVLGELIRLKFPEVHRRVEETGANYVSLCTKWFICLFADVVPIETTMRIFDSLFFEGDKILFRASLALVKVHHDQLVKCADFPELLIAFRRMVLDKKTLWCHDFMQTMFTIPGSLSRRQIAKLRARFRKQVLEENVR